MLLLIYFEGGNSDYFYKSGKRDIWKNECYLFQRGKGTSFIKGGKETSSK